MGVTLTPVIVFVRDFERCVRFYSDAFGIEPVRFDDHWAEYDFGGLRFALHAGYRGSERHVSGRPVALHFVVDDIETTLARVRGAGGEAGEAKRYTSRSEGKDFFEAHFTDPDGNEFEITQVLARFD